MLGESVMYVTSERAGFQLPAVRLRQDRNPNAPEALSLDAVVHTGTLEDENAAGTNVFRV